MEKTKNNLKQIKNSSILLEKISDLKIEKKYFDYQITTNSMRLDSLISKLSNLSRKDSQDKIINKEVLLNQQEVTKSTIIVNENDIISIRKIGKFKIDKIIGISKKNKLIVNIKKYM